MARIKDTSHLGKYSPAGRSLDLHQALMRQQFEQHERARQKRRQHRKSVKQAQRARLESNAQDELNSQPDPEDIKRSLELAHDDSTLTNAAITVPQPQALEGVGNDKTIDNPSSPQQQEELLDFSERMQEPDDATATAKHSPSQIWKSKHLSEAQINDSPTQPSVSDLSVEKATIVPQPEYVQTAADPEAPTPVEADRVGMDGSESPAGAFTQEPVPEEALGSQSHENQVKYETPQPPPRYDFTDVEFSDTPSSSDIPPSVKAKMNKLRQHKPPLSYSQLTSVERILLSTQEKSKK